MSAVSVVMPVFNRATTVGRAVESVLAQDFADFELIVVDDGSKDGTAAAVAAFRDPRIRLLRMPKNIGGNAARNKGLLAAESPLIAFLDSDDAFLPHKLGHLVRYFAARPEIDALIDSFEIRYPPERGKPPFRAINPALEDSREIERRIFRRQMYKATPALSVRKTAALRAGLFDETLRRRQDFDFVIRLCRKTACASTDEVLWIKTWSKDAISAKQSTFMDATIELCRRHPRYLVEPDFRPGLARDTARHFLRLASKGAVSDALRDGKRLRLEFGARAFAGLVAEGFGEMARRRFGKAAG